MGQPRKIVGENPGVKNGAGRRPAKTIGQIDRLIDSG
jgi:hypothetical protein